MNSTAALVIALVISVVWIVMNTMIAIAVMRQKKDQYKSTFGREERSMSELHRRVEELKQLRDQQKKDGGDS
ncbi:MAG: hypothetical protein ACOYZ8_17175 [Chloroflexota bacterium]